MARGIYGHMAIIHEYGDGYHEPRSEAIECECGAHISDWMQFYYEAPDWEQDWLDHLTFVAHEITAAPIYAELADDYKATYAQLNQDLTHFGRIDCSMPGVRRETAGAF